ncbi:hypothetical protein FQA39_LY03482 [Lamprigera yunnana]|nr:hypothetical protein FQA39_LY03482 [Lamprigera yunnana]
MYKYTALFLVLLYVIDVQVYGANILAVFFVPSISHQVVFQPIWRELSLRGHKVTVLTPDPLKDPKLINLTEVDLSFSYEIIRSADMQNTIQKDLPITSIVTGAMDLMSAIAEAELMYEPVQALLKDESKHFDLVIVEFLNPVFTALSAKYKCPLVGITSLGAIISGHDAIGNPSHPVLNPDILLPYTGILSFYERLYSTYYSVWYRYYYHYHFLPKQDKIARKYISDDLPYLGDIEKSISLLFLNVNPIIHPIRPNVPGVIELGKMHIKKPKSLPKDIQKYLDGAKEGVVYFSLGSNVRSANLSLDLREKIMEGLRTLPYKVLWKWEEDSLPNQPKNVLTNKWFPQQDVLRHRNIKVFLTQGGLQSMEEAITGGVPLVGMPFFGDQPLNVRKMVNLGIAVAVDTETLTPTVLKEAIMEVAENPKYRNKVKDLSQLLSDVPATGLEKAMWWIEYVLRHKGAKHLRSPAVDLPLYQYFLLDIIVFVFVSIFVAACIAYKLVRFVVAHSDNTAERKSKVH